MVEKEGEKRRTRGNLTRCLGLFSHPWGTGPRCAKVERARERKRTRIKSDVSEGWRK